MARKKSPVKPNRFMDFSTDLVQLWVRDGGLCHHCKEETWLGDIGKPGGVKSKRATRDHVVPRYYGGADSLDNYVLACADCNSKRGHKVECVCEFCSNLFEDMYKSKSYIDVVISEIEKFNKPKIRRVSRGWRVYVHGKPFNTFPTWDCAIQFISTDKRFVL